jgi:hypothetical protein
MSRKDSEIALSQEMFSTAQEETGVTSGSKRLPVVIAFWG